MSLCMGVPYGSVPDDRYVCKMQLDNLAQICATNLYYAKSQSKSIMGLLDQHTIYILCSLTSINVHILIFDFKYYQLLLLLLLLLLTFLKKGSSCS